LMIFRIRGIGRFVRFTRFFMVEVGVKVGVIFSGRKKVFD